ncbi:hypothetical protein [Streptomyces sp. NPDC017993]|uniref:hypothetical protein n=1 Tax=Streptomyces sp. NPDC017993 TaxID=3365027 RepID=UPI0037BB471B
MEIVELNEAFASQVLAVSRALGTRLCPQSPFWLAAPGTHPRCVVGIFPVRPVPGRPSALRGRSASTG